MTAITPEQRRIYRREHKLSLPIKPRQWQDSDQTTRTDDSGIIAALRADNDRLRHLLARAERHIENIQTERRQLREQLTALQEGEA